MMMRTKRRSAFKILSACIAIFITAAITAHSFAGDEYDCSWSTIDGGGTTSSGGDFSLSGTIGQPDAGVMAGASFELDGGFWPGLQDGAAEPPCPGDIDGSGEVGFDDFTALLASWGPCTDCPADLDGDGDVDFDDFVALLAAWGPCP